MTRRRAGGHPNGTCKNCPRPAKSLNADYCSRECRDEAREREAKVEHYKQQWEEQQMENDDD